jgi:hypothetical protein
MRAPASADASPGPRAELRAWAHAHNRHRCGSGAPELLGTAAMPGLDRDAAGWDWLTSSLRSAVDTTCVRASSSSRASLWGEERRAPSAVTDGMSSRCLPRPADASIAARILGIRLLAWSSLGLLPSVAMRRQGARGACVGLVMRCAGVAGYRKTYSSQLN